ncbi:restriction endonuclease subunit S [Cereibacter sphaeroides]|uniref:restriction endonuclease subunit S n=1 Tax=Cereibacter sphaeroides TaxID=1063 RepID=UPI003990CC06
MNHKPLHTPLAAQTWEHVQTWSRLDQACLGVFDCPHTTPTLTDDGPFVARSQDIRGRVFDYRNAGRVSEETYAERITRAEPEYGDLLYSREGTYFGIAAEIPKHTRICLGQRMVLIRPDPARLDHRFLRYWLNSPTMEGHLAGFRDGSVAERLNMATIRALPVPLFPLPAQRKIATILGALDDKIEMNRKTAATLEAMARALYRAWFVDFDPVWAKLEGRAPAHMEPATAALFPDSFGDDGLPEGWCFRTLSEVCTQIKETVKPMGAPDAPFWHFSLPAYDAAATPVLEYGAAIKSNKGFVPNNAILFSRLNPAIPRIWWSRYDHTKGMPAASTEFYVAKARTPQEVSWLYCLLSSAEFLEHAQSRVTGTSNSHQRVTPSALAEIEVTDSPEAILNAFGAIAGPFFERTHALKAESQTLAALRDSLLPRLMSGELRVGEAREQIEEVA